MIPGNKIKEELIEKISHTENEELLSQIARLVHLESEIEDVYHLSPEEREAVNEGLTQIKNGQFLTNEEINAKFDKWLKR